MTLQTGRRRGGDGGAMAAPSAEPRTMLYQRFTEAQQAACVAAGWRFAAGWYVLGGFRWAWFCREDTIDG